MKMPVSFFEDPDKIILKFIQRGKEAKIAKGTKWEKSVYPISRLTI